MRTVIHTVAVISIALGLTTLTSPALAGGNETADVHDGGNGSLTYEFYDDPLAAGNFVPSGGEITVVNRQIRTVLIRPRTQFIVEMLKSVEAL